MEVMSNDDRPRTSRGRSAITRDQAYIPTKQPQIYQEYVERPKTSKGRRRPDPSADIYQTVSTDSATTNGGQPRPGTSRGSRGAPVPAESSQEPAFAIVGTAAATADSEILYSIDRPVTSRKSRHGTEPAHAHRSTPSSGATKARPRQQQQQTGARDRPHSRRDGQAQRRSRPESVSDVLEGRVSKQDRPTAGLRRSSVTHQPAALVIEMELEREVADAGRRTSNVSLTPDLASEVSVGAADDVTPRISRAARPKSAKGRTRQMPAGAYAALTQEPTTADVTSRAAQHTPDIATYTQHGDVTGHSRRSPVNRPSSSTSLSKYSVLPRIGGGGAVPIPEPRGDVISDVTLGSPPPVDVLKMHAPMSVIGDTLFEAPDVIESASDVIHKPKSILKREKRDSDAHVTSPSVSPYPALSRDVMLPPEPTEAEERLLLAVKLPDGSRIQRHFRPTETLSTVIHFAEHSARLDFSACDVICDAPKRVFHDKTATVGTSGLLNRTVLHLQLPNT